MWVPPGQKADHTKWRFDVAQKSFLPPGTKSGPKGTQVEMPMNYQGTEPTGFHMVASPQGTQAPIEHINYTPETGEVHGRGQAAPPHMLNYTLMPEDALGAGVGQGSSPAMGMGAGASLGMDQQPFPGTPPLFNSPMQMMGPGPTRAGGAPAMNGGTVPFDQRMGMGAEEDDVITGLDPTKPPPGAATGGTVPPPDATQPAPATAAPPAATPAPGAGAPAPGYPNGVPRGTPLKPDGTYIQPGEALPIQGTVGTIGYRVFERVDEFRQPVWRYNNGPANASEKDRYQSYDNNDGTVTIVDFSKNPPEVTKRGTADPGIAAKTAADAELAKTNLEIKRLELQAQQATTDTARQEALLKIQQLQLQVQQAQANVDKANIEAGLAGQPKVEPKQSKIVGKDREIFILNPETDQYESTGMYEPSEAGDWEKFTDPVRGAVYLVNKNTQQEMLLHPIDTYKEYPPEKRPGGKWVQWDPGKQTYKTIYQDDPDYATQWSGDELIAVDKNNPLGEPKVIWKKKPTAADDDAHTAAIDAHNKEQIEAEKTLQELLHPKPLMMGQGSMYLPPGLNLNIEDMDPWSGKTSTRSASGGAFDAATLKRIADLQARMSGQGGGQPQQRQATQDTGTQTTQTSRDTTGAGKTTTGGGDTRDTSVGEQMAGDPYKPGWPGSDPRLSGGLRPPSQQTTSSGDIAHYDEQGNLTGIDYLNTAPPGYEEGQGESDITEEYFDPETGKKNPLYGAGHMGAGMAAGTTGWAPKPGAFAPAQGPGFLGGAGQEEQQFYDADGNPLDPGDMGSGADANAVLEKLREIMGTTTMPVPTAGGHAPPLDIKIPAPGPANKGEIKPQGPSINVAPKPEDQPGVTDKGANWVPDLKGIVTQKVNEPLKKLLGWPKLEETDSQGPPVGTEGGFDQPEIDPVNLRTGEMHGPQEPSDWGGHPDVKDLGHLMGEGGTGPADWEEMQQEEGIGKATGKQANPELERILQELRDMYQTMGTGQEPGGMMPPSGGPSSSPGIPPQGPGGQPPQWLLTLLRTHPELLKMAGLSGSPAGGAPSPSIPPTAATGAPSPPSGPPAGGSPPTPSAPTAGWKPPTPAPTTPTSPGGPGEGGPSSAGIPGESAPVAPSPEGGPMTPPLPPEDVAGIGHRFGQEMNVGEPQHSGVDLQAPEGTPTSSPVDGFVQRVEDNPEGLGVTVVIRGMDGSEHRLGHLKSTTAYAGMQVKMGQNLGSPVGETGMTTGAHLHWGVKDGQGQPADPTQALGPMANMPPVPGTEMMGPPGGVGGAAQAGAPMMGGGQEAPEYGKYALNPLNWDEPWAAMSTGFSGGQEGGMGSLDSPATGGAMGDLRQLPRMRPWNITPGATGTGQEAPPQEQEPSIGQGMAQFIRPPQNKPQKQGAGTDESDRGALHRGWERAQEANRETQRVDRRPGEEFIRSATLKDPKYNPFDPAQQEVYAPNQGNVPKRPDPIDPNAGGGRSNPDNPNETVPLAGGPFPIYNPDPSQGSEGGGWNPEQAGWLLGRRNPLNTGGVDPNITARREGPPIISQGGHQPGLNVPLGPNINTGMPIQMPGGHTPGIDFKLPDWLSSRMPNFNPKDFTRHPATPGEPFPLTQGMASGGQEHPGLGDLTPNWERAALQEYRMNNPDWRDKEFGDMRPMGDPEVDQMEKQGRTGTGQEAGKGKRKRKRAGWKPKGRVGAGQMPPQPQPQPQMQGQGDSQGALQRMLQEEWQRMQMSAQPGAVR